MGILDPWIIEYKISETDLLKDADPEKLKLWELSSKLIRRGWEWNVRRNLWENPCVSGRVYTLKEACELEGLK